MVVESKALNIYRVTGSPRHILTKKLRCKLQSVQIVIFHIIKEIYLRLGDKIMENFRLLPVVVIQLNMNVRFANRFARKFDLIFAHAQTLFSPVFRSFSRKKILLTTKLYICRINKNNLKMILISQRTQKYKRKTWEHLAAITDRLTSVLFKPGFHMIVRIVPVVSKKCLNDRDDHMETLPRRSQTTRTTETTSIVWVAFPYDRPDPLNIFLDDWDDRDDPDDHMETRL